MTYKTNIEHETENNTNYRTTLFTGEHMQLTVMSLKAGEDIPEETHPDIDQFIRVEVGEAFVRVEDAEHIVGEDEIIIIPAGKKHYVKNNKEEDLKLYSIYSPPEHPAGTIHTTKAEADADHHHH